MLNPLFRIHDCISIHFIVKDFFIFKSNTDLSRKAFELAAKFLIWIKPWHQKCWSVAFPSKSLNNILILISFSRNALATKHDHTCMRCKLKWRREFSDEDQEVVKREYYTIQSNSAKDQHLRCAISINVNRKTITFAPTTSVKKEKAICQQVRSYRNHCKNKNNKKTSQLFEAHTTGKTSLRANWNNSSNHRVHIKLNTFWHWKNKRPLGVHSLPIYN